MTTVPESIDISANGESNVMRYLLECKLLSKKSIVFDVGANIGEWTDSILKLLPEIGIHSFEPDPSVCEKLYSKFKENKNVRIFNGALSNGVGQAEFHVYPSDRMSSLFQRDLSSMGISGEQKSIFVRMNTLDNYCEDNGITHIHFLKIDVEGAENNVLRGAKTFLGNSRVDIIQFEYGGTYKDSGETLKNSYDMLRGYGYEVFKILPEGLEYYPFWKDEYENYAYSNFLAVNERLVSLLAKKKPRMLDLGLYLDKYRISLNGVIHVGAHEGEEISSYQALGADKLLLVEANPSVYERLKKNISGIDNCQAICCAASDHAGEVGLHLTNMDQSSSILPLAKHREIYPQIVMEQIVKVPAKTIDEIVSLSYFDACDFNFLSLDIQGAELMALKGATNTLQDLDAIITEVNFEELYKGAPGIELLDGLLAKFNFVRVATTCPYHPSWGDALYVKKARDLELNNPFNLPVYIETVNKQNTMEQMSKKLFQIVRTLHEQGEDERAKSFFKETIKNDEFLFALVRCVEPVFLNKIQPNDEAIFVSLLNQVFPSRFPVVMLMGKLMEKLGHTKVALDCFDFACKLNPGHGESFTRSLLLQIPHKSKPEQDLSDDCDILGLPFLGKAGRFANQLFQYTFGLCYANKYKLKIETPDWIGRYFFGLNDSLITKSLPHKCYEDKDISKLFNAAIPHFKNTHISGYFNSHSAPYAPFMRDIQQAFIPKGLFGDVANKMRSWLREINEPVIAIHLRRGDFGHGKFWIAPDEQYLEWLESVYTKYPNARLYIASDNPDAAEPYKKYNPLMLSDSGINLGAFNFFLDFISLTEADFVAISNSTFSFFASMLNQKASVFMRPDPHLKKMIEYDPWNSEIMLSNT